MVGPAASDVSARKRSLRFTWHVRRAYWRIALKQRMSDRPRIRRAANKAVTVMIASCYAKAYRPLDRCLVPVRTLLAASPSGAAIVRAHGALFFDLPVALFLGVALVVLLLAAGQADLDFHLVALPVHRGGNQGVTLALDRAD
jgi:hypothetical protein